MALWLPSLLCRGMGGWQLWLAPVAMLIATRLLIRAWTGGRIKERRPLAALIGFAAVGVVWAGANFAYRAWEIPDVGEPVDREAFRMALPQGQQNQDACRGQKAEVVRNHRVLPDQLANKWVIYFATLLAQAIQKPQQEQVLERVPGVVALKEDVELCYAAGMSDYLAKPFQLSDLAAVLDPWLLR